MTLNLAPPPAATAAAGGASAASSMKVPVKPPPLKTLPPLSCFGASSGVPVSPLAMDRLPLPLSLPFSPDLLWRYPLSGLSSSSSGQPPSSPLLDVKQQLPGALGPDPRTWAREDVVTFLRWCEREFDLPGLDLEKFQMNGKALCLLNKSDIAERAPGSGDVVHNALQLLLRDAPYGGGRVPSSPLTPHGPGSLSSLHSQQQHALSHALAAAAAHQNAQSHAAAAAAAAASGSNGSSSGGSGGSGSGSSSSSSHLLSPPNSARTPTSASWPSASPLFPSAADFHNLGHLIQQTNSVTLSPAPSMDGNSQGGSPSHAEQSAATASAASAATAAAAALAAQAHLSFYTHALQAHSQQQSAAAANGNGSHSGSGSQSQSDSESESLHDSSPQRSPAPSTPGHHHSLPPPLSLQSLSGLPLPAPPMSPVTLSSKDAGSGGGGGNSPGDGLDSGSNGRLLWDFLQQLLNDPSQRYSHYIAWKNRETGVFKITDPAGLARLWGIQKNHPSMNYDKMSRALRYYYRVNILRKVQGERHCYQFLRNPVELKSIKNISLLRHQMAAAAAAAASTTSSTSNINNNNSSSKVVDSTDASSERYSPSSTADEYHHHHHYDDCDMPTDLSMDRMAPPYLSAIKTEKLAS